MDDQTLLADYVKRAELAAQLRKDPRTLERWERQRVGPPVTRIGREPYYFIPSVRDWLRSRETGMVREPNPVRRRA